MQYSAGVVGHRGRGQADTVVARGDVRGRFRVDGKSRDLLPFPEAGERSHGNRCNATARVVFAHHCWEIDVLGWKA